MDFAVSTFLTHPSTFDRHGMKFLERKTINNQFYLLLQFVESIMEHTIKFSEFSLYETKRVPESKAHMMAMHF